MGSFIFGTVSITFVRRCLTPSPFPCLQAGVAALTQQTDCVVWSLATPRAWRFGC
jgi:hypothetical protein